MELKTGSEAGEVKQAEWSPEDIAWLEQYVNPALRGVAMRYGRPLFAMALRIGLMQHCINLLGQRLQKNAELSQMVNLLAMAVNDQSGLALKAIGFTQGELMECKGDIERVGLMSVQSPAGVAAANGAKVSPGGIILDS